MKDLYADVTNKIIEKLEAGVIPWEQGWVTNANTKLPIRNTGEGYKGINQLILWMQAQDFGYTSNQWATYKQAQAEGWQVRKGEKATSVCYFSTFEVEDAKTDKVKNVPFLKTFSVFNYTQIDGAPVIDATPVVEHNQDDRIWDIEDFVSRTDARIFEGGVKACYRPTTDDILMPKFEHFKGANYYYRTLLHELAHWTGPRLEREFGSNFGDMKYAKEEIVAELTSAFLCADLGVHGQSDRNATYIDSWLQVLKSDKKAIFKLASLSSKAADYLKDLTAQKVAVAA